MISTSLWIELIFIGLIIFGIIIFLFVLKKKKIFFSDFVLLTCFVTFDLILFGVFTRLTDSGLGCPDWPGCYGHSNPTMALSDIRIAELSMPTGPVTIKKAWIEMLHRFFAIATSILIFVIAIWSFCKRKIFKKNMWISLFILFLVLVQGAFGAYSVISKLKPIIVTMHLILAITLLSNLTYLYISTKPFNVQKNKIDINSIYIYPGKLINFCLFVLIVQIFLGGWVSSNYATLACDGFFLCHGKWIPEMDFYSGFQIFRELGFTRSREILPFSALVAIHWLHRTIGVIVLMLFLFLSYKVIQYGSSIQSTKYKKIGCILLGLSVLQVCTGIGNILLQWPLLIALVHTSGSIGLLINIIFLKTKKCI